MPNPLDTLTIEEHFFADDGRVPNNPSLPLIVYRSALATGPRCAADCEKLFADNGWSGGWRNGIYAHHHYHSTAHEVLGIAAGSVRVRLGGEDGTTVELHAGDVVVKPGRRRPQKRVRQSRSRRGRRLSRRQEPRHVHPHCATPRARASQRPRGAAAGLGSGLRQAGTADQTVERRQSRLTAGASRQVKDSARNKRHRAHYLMAHPAARRAGGFRRNIRQRTFHGR